MDFRILGGIEVRRNGELLAVGGGRQKAVLVALLKHPNESLTRARLIEAVWSDPPDSAEANLRTYLGRLRKALDPSPDGEPRITAGAGYVRLRVDDGEFDLREFETAVRRGDEAADPAASAGHYGRALELWRGDPFHDADRDTPLSAFAAELCERHRAVVHKWRDARLAAGEHGELVAELRSAIVTEPFSEPTVELLMRALHLGGRTDEALALFRDTRVRLIDTLGVEPSRSLNELHRRMLAGDEPREPRSRPAAAPEAPRVIPTQLPADIAGFTGRLAETEVICAAVRDRRRGALIVSSIEGMAGVGKTALAVHAANRIAAEFPDGQLFIDLHGFDSDSPPTDPSAALDRLLRVLGVEPGRIPETLDERAAAYRSIVSGRRLLVVLDNANSEEQVRPLLPGTDTGLAVVTSRRSLAGLDQANPIRLDLLSRDDAVRLLASIIGPERLEGEDEAIAVVETCGLLPLAIRLAGGRMRNRPEWTLKDLRARLERAGLAELSTGDRSVAAAFGVSYAELDEPVRLLFRRLGLHPGHDFDVYAAASLVDRTMPETQRLLDELVDAHLLDEFNPGRYRFHDLVREYAGQQAAVEGGDDRTAALARLAELHIYLAGRVYRTEPATFMTEPAVDRRPLTPYPDVPDLTTALAIMDTEYANTLSLIDSAASTGIARQVVELAKLSHTYLWRMARFDDLLNRAPQLIRMARSIGDGASEATLRIDLGACLHKRGQYARAVDQHTRAGQIAERIGSPALRFTAVFEVVMVQLVECRYETAEKTLLEALDDLVPDVGPRAEMEVRNRLAHCAFRRGDSPAAERSLDRAIALATELGDDSARARYAYNSAELQRDAGNFGNALDRLETARRHFGPGIPAENLALLLTGQAECLLALDRADDALRIHRESVALAESTGDARLLSMVLTAAGRCFLELGDHPSALATNYRAEELAQGISPGNHALAKQAIGESLHATGQRHQARVYWEDALHRLEAIGIPGAETVRESLAGLADDEPGDRSS